MLRTDHYRTAQDISEHRSYETQSRFILRTPATQSDINLIH